MTRQAEDEALRQPPKLFSTITCPICGISKIEKMPTDACHFFYRCTGCGTLLRPRPGDCCVFCSYGDVACPPVQVHDPSRKAETAFARCRTTRQ